MSFYDCLIFQELLSEWPTIMRQLDREFQTYQMQTVADFVEHFNEFSLQCQLFWRDGWQTKKTMDWERWVFCFPCLHDVILWTFVQSFYVCVMASATEEYPGDFINAHWSHFTHTLYKQYGKKKTKKLTRNLCKTIKLNYRCDNLCFHTIGPY